MKHHMVVTLLEIAGYDSAIRGLSLMRRQPTSNMIKVCKKLANLDHGHNKYLEHIQLWFMIEAPRYWWQEADTYRHSSKQSESTMWNFRNDISDMDYHRFREMFEDGDVSYLYYTEMMLLSKMIKEEDGLAMLKRKLIEGFIQTREWTFNLKTYREMVIQRIDHKLKHWRIFLGLIYKVLPEECRDILGFDEKIILKLSNY